MSEFNDSIGKLNAAVYRNLQSILNIKLQDIPIHGGQHDFLYVISKSEGITQKELSQRLFVDKSTTAKAIKSLVALGYIKKETSPEDKRFTKLYLTEKGHMIKARIQDTFLELVQITARNLSVQEAEQTVLLLESVLSGLIEEKLRLSKK